jgi:hypothetical protein
LVRLLHLNTRRKLQKGVQDILHGRVHGIGLRKIRTMALQCHRISMKSKFSNAPKPKCHKKSKGLFYTITTA